MFINQQQILAFKSECVISPNDYPVVSKNETLEIIFFIIAAEESKKRDAISIDIK